MMNIFAEAVGAGSACYTLRLLSQDVMAAVIKDEELTKRTKAEYFDIYWQIIFMLALKHEMKHIMYSFKQSYWNMPEEEICNYISRIKSDYLGFADIMEAIFIAKRRDFISLGASEEQADDCVSDWISLEIN
jgi:hypothetical protein